MQRLELIVHSSDKMMCISSILMPRAVNYLSFKTYAVFADGRRLVRISAEYKGYFVRFEYNLSTVWYLTTII